MTNACGTTSNFRVAGSIPAGAANRLRSSVGRAERQFHNRLVVTLNRQPRRMPDGTTAPNEGMLREVDSSPCWRSLARAGLPMFHHLFVAAANDSSMTRKNGIRFSNGFRLSRGNAREWRMQAGLQVARPSKRREVGCSNHSLALRSGVAQSPSCRSLSPADRTGRMPAGIHWDLAVRLRPSVG